MGNYLNIGIGIGIGNYGFGGCALIIYHTRNAFCGQMQGE